MRVPQLAGLALVLAAMPARGSEPTLLEQHTLSPIDSLPRSEDVTSLTLTRLSELATGASDLGIQLRAIRALPTFCVPDCLRVGGVEHPAHATTLAVIGQTAGLTDGRSILKRRAGIETLGLIRSNESSDVDLLVALLDDASRDIRATVATTLLRMCAQSASPALRARSLVEQVPQVKFALTRAVLGLVNCIK
jgi:hypothetical protein